MQDPKNLTKNCAGYLFLEKSFAPLEDNHED